VVFAGFRGDAQVGTEKRRTDLGNEFFHGITGIPEPLAAEVAIEPRFMPSPVTVMPNSA
jgi:hypothetical protein